MRVSFSRFHGWNKGSILAAAMLAALLLSSAKLRADSGPPTGFGPDGLSASSTDDAGQYLGSIYKDEIGGFKVAPPLGSRIITRAGIDLVSFVNDAKQWGGSVQVANLTSNPPPGAVPQKASIEDYLKTIAPELGKTFRAVQVLDTHLLKFQGHDAARIDTSMEAEIGAASGGHQNNAPGQLVALYRQQLIVQTSDTKFMVLTLYTPLSDRDAATTTFGAMLTSFELLDPTEVAKHLAVTIKAGKDWLAQRTAEELTPKLSTQPQLFRMKVNGSDVGYIRFDESEDTRSHDHGVMVTINSRSFPSDGSIIYGQNIASWAYAGDAAPDKRPLSSTWANTTKTVTNRPNVPRDNQSFWIRQIGTLQLEGISRYSAGEIEQMQKHREDLIQQNAPADKIPPPIEIPPKQYHLQVVYEGDPTQPQIKGLDVDIPMDRAAPLPSVLDYLWPRVVDLTKPTEMTFVSYNSGLHKLTYHTLSVIGPSRISINNQPIDCVRCLDEMEPNSTTLWVDSTGKILMMRTSDQSLLVPTTTDEMERLWAGKIREQ